MPPIKVMTYTGPDGSVVRNPTNDFLQRLIFRERGRHWRGGSGDSGLSIDEHSRGGAVSAIPGEPSLMFYLVERHGFFFTYFSGDPSREQYVPFAGGDPRPWVGHVIGGLEFYAPRACFVSRPFAWEIVREFLETRKRSRAVRWVKRRRLKFPDPEENPPRKVDLA